MPPDERVSMNIESILKELQAGMLSMQLTLATIQADMRHATSAAAGLEAKNKDLNDRVTKLDERIQKVETKQYYMFILGGALGVLGSALGVGIIQYLMKRG